MNEVVKRREELSKRSLDFLSTSRIYDFNYYNPTSIKDNSGLIPLRAFCYAPADAEIMEELLGKPIRRVFTFPLEAYTPNEKQSLKQLFQYCIEKKYIFPPEYTYVEMLRQLQGQDYNVEKAFAEIAHEIEWKRSNLPVPLDADVKEVLNSGFIYIHGRDNKYRPLIFLNPGRFDKAKMASYQKAMKFFMEYISGSLVVPGRLESWNIVVDCGEIQMTKIPFDLKSLFEFIKGVYRCRLYKLYIVNMGVVFTMCWNIARLVIGGTIEAKATKVDSNDGKYDKLFERVNRKQVEKKYGGEAPDLKEGEYFPVTFRCDEYYAASDDDKYGKVELDYVENDGEIFYEISEN